MLYTTIITELQMKQLYSFSDSWKLLRYRYVFIKQQSRHTHSNNKKMYSFSLFVSLCKGNNKTVHFSAQPDCVNDEKPFTKELLKIRQRDE